MLLGITDMSHVKITAVSVRESVFINDLQHDKRRTCRRN